MPLVILMRHGQADNNVNKILVGRHIESHLTEFGKNQVLDTAKYLKEISIDKVLVSPVVRTVETAEIVCGYLGVSYEIDERLYEIELGKLVGMNYEEIILKYGNLFLQFYTENDAALTHYGVESFASIKQRIKNILDEITDRYTNKNVLMISHLDPIKAAISILLDLKPETLYRWHIRNASLTILKNDERVYSLTGVNVMGMPRYLDE
jgi:2,3-bisphosphoglycerate-dependent phosphoglycerate mutase